MPKTIRERLCAALEARGYQKVDSRSRKYINYKHVDNPDRILFVGKSGALRTGKNVTDSIAVENFKKKLLEELK